MQGIKKMSWCLTRALKTYQSTTCSRSAGLVITSVRCFTLSQQSSMNHGKHSVAIVGSGPAGFYTAQQLLKSDPSVIVDIYEKLPVPFGLVRFGVAPDHPEVKNVINTFTQTAHKERCSFYGNIEVGTDVTLKDLREAYSAVVLCYGASDDRMLGIPGENLPNVFSARSFVGWYNGLPQDAGLPVNLDCESAVVLGHGNVALDVARILLTPIGILEKTDISEHALEVLRKSQVKKVHLVGRRGPLQVAFTIKELREMVNLPDTRTVIQPSDVDGLNKIIKDLPRPRRRLTELMYNTAVSPSDSHVKLWAEASREWRLVFRRSPLKILHNETGLVQGLELVANRLEGENPEKQVALPTDVKETIECGLVLRSIGYKSLALDECVPFNAKKGVVDNENSRVRGEKGLYCAGWVGKGPVGVILGTMTDAFETGKLVAQDLQSGVLESNDNENRANLIKQLKEKAVTFMDWEKIDAAEIMAGEKIGKPREKLTRVEDMLNVVKS